MEYYSYVNIFEQKGVAYILLLSFLVLAILFIRYLSVPEKKDSVPGKNNSTNAG
jgi:uncharacterized membrane protein